MKVYIVHPCHDYGVESVHATREGAEAHKVRMEEEQWDTYRERTSARENRTLMLSRSDFIDAHYIHEIEVTT